MPIEENKDKAELSAEDKDGHQTKEESQKKSHSEPHVGMGEKKQAQKPVKYDLDERPWPVC